MCYVLTFDIALINSFAIIDHDFIYLFLFNAEVVGCMVR